MCVCVCVCVCVIQGTDDWPRETELWLRGAEAFYVCVCLCLGFCVYVHA